MKSGQQRHAFTLVELLVVIGIIAILLAILMPSLSKAQQQAQSVQCLANLRSIGQAMMMYAGDFNGGIAGAGATSNRHFWDSNYNPIPSIASGNIPQGSPIQVFDYIAPLAPYMGIKLDPSNNAATRYDQYRKLEQFQCVAAIDTMADAFGTPSAGPGQMLSYNTATFFLLQPGHPAPGATGHTRISTGASWPLLPPGYGPKISKVGASSLKIYAADGGKFSRGTAPNYSLAPYALSTATAGSTNAFSDFGAAFRNTNSYYRVAGAIDSRVFGARHSARTPGRKWDEYSLNAVFYDGHAENMSLAEAANPVHWLPSGSTIVSTTNVQQDVITKYAITAGYKVP